MTEKQILDRISPLEDELQRSEVELKGCKEWGGQSSYGAGYYCGKIKAIQEDINWWRINFND